MKVKEVALEPHLKRKSASMWTVAALGCVLAACNLVADSSVMPTPLDNGETTVEARALVHEEVDSPIFEELKANNVQMVSYDGSQDVADFQLVIFDGDSLTPEAVRDHELVRKALRAHKWVLAVDAAEEHKRTGLGDYLHVSTKDVSPGYLARITQEPNDQVGAQVLELPRAPTPFGDAAVVTAQTLGAGGGATAEGAAQFVRNALRQLDRKGVTPQQDDPGPAIPSGVIYYPVYLQQTVPWTAKGAQKRNQGGTQSVYYQLNYSFELFLDNATNPAGDFQWVSVRIDGQANPTSGTGNFVNRDTDEQAWFQDRLKFQIAPGAAADARFTSYGSSPETVNGQSTVTSGVSFTVGLDSDGPSGSFGYSYSQSRTISDWKITNNSSGNLMAWDYRSSSPYDADGTYACGTTQNEWTYNGFSKASCYPLTPNDLSLNTLSAHAQGVWKTQGVVADWVDFDAYSEQHVADAYCSSDFGLICLLANDALSNRGGVGQATPISINMAAVVPIATESITFGENPATAGDTVTGTITLASAAERNTTVLLSSNSENATVLPNVTIPQGQTSANFQVLTNANGIASGESTVATITAFYAGDFQAQLTVANP